MSHPVLYDNFSVSWLVCFTQIYNSYIGYGNEETHWITDLKPSQGEAARIEQTRNSEQPAEAEEEGEQETPNAGDVAGDESGGATQQVSKCGYIGYAHNINLCLKGFRQICGHI